MSFLDNRDHTRSLKSPTIIACLVAAIASALSCSDRSADNKGRERPPWNQMEIDLSPSWSADGSKIIYGRERASSGRDTSWQYGAFIHDVNTGRDTCVWPGVAFDGFSWSPDGQRVALVQAAQVFIHDFVLDSTRQITFANRNFFPSWSPCGDKLIFFDTWNYNGLQIYDIVGDSIAYLGLHEAFYGDWMPNCSTLVLMDTCVHTECGIYGYNIYTDSLWFITNTPGYKREIAVSPDGRTVVFGVVRDLWAVNTSGGEPYRLTTEGGAWPDWSPDGQWIVYTKVDWWNGYLWLMRPDGSEKHQITF